MWSTFLDRIRSRWYEVQVDAGTVQVGKLVLPARRCWPLRALPDGRKPTITSRHAIHNPSRPTHRGVDLFYRRLPTDPPMRIGDGGRTAKWWIPEMTEVIAPAAGLVEIAGNSKTGWRVWIRHAGGLATGGFHMTQIFVKAGDAVRMADPIGIVGDNPADHDPDHLHWEVYEGAIGKYPRGTVDPELWLKGAEVLPAA